MSHQERMPIDAVVFDYGEVIAGSDACDWTRMVRIAEIPETAFFDSYWHYRLDYDRGWTPQQYWSKVAEHAGTKFSADRTDRLTETDAQHWMHVRQPVLDWILRLKEGGKKLGILSNMPSGVAQIFRRDAPWLAHFDSLVFSCDLRVCKPDPEIYRASLDQLSVAPERALFLDDKQYNVEGARAIGMQGVLFDSLEATQARLTKFDLPL